MTYSKSFPKLTAAALTVFLPLATSAPVAAFEGSVTPETVDTARDYSPFVGRSYPDQILFGDLHFHTEISFDAGLIGTSLSIHYAFRVARGEKILSNTGQPVQLVRPLDFLAITEHAEMLGLATGIRTSNPRLLQDEWGKRIHEQFREGQQARMSAFAEIINLGTVQGKDPTAGLDLDGDLWLEIIETVDQYNDPGRFTTLSGFEWTFTPKGDNLHRVILFGDGAGKTGQTRPLSFFDAPDPELLWDYLANYEAKTGGHAVAVPHNANMSNGLMFNKNKFNGSPMDAEYAAKRIRW